MHRRLIAIVVAICFAFGEGGCVFTSNNKDYDEILMPAQTGSVLQRRVQVKKIEPEEKPKKKKDKEKTSSPKPKPDEEPSAEATPKPEPESTPATDRFR